MNKSPVQVTYLKMKVIAHNFFPNTISEHWPFRQVCYPFLRFSFDLRQFKAQPSGTINGIKTCGNKSVYFQ